MAKYRIVDVDALRSRYCGTDKTMCEECAHNAWDCQHIDVYSVMDLCGIFDDIEETGEGVPIDTLVEFLSRDYMPPGKPWEIFGKQGVMDGAEMRKKIRQAWRKTLRELIGEEEQNEQNG